MNILLQTLAHFLLLTTASAKPAMGPAIAKRDILVMRRMDGKCGEDFYCHSNVGNTVVKTSDCLVQRSQDEHCTFSRVKVTGRCTKIALGECSYRGDIWGTLYGYDRACSGTAATEGRTCRWVTHLGDV